MEKGKHGRICPVNKSSLKTLLLVGTVTMANILNVANITAVSISLPTMGRDLKIVEYNLQWIVSAYALSAGCLQLFLGRIADLHGCKKTFIAGCACMGVFGLACGFARNELTMDILRAFQGLGPAAAIPAAVGILTDKFPPGHTRSMVLATFSAGAPVGAAIGSAIGGVLTQLTAQTWRSTFWFLSGISWMCCIGALLSIDKDVDHVSDRRIDWVGALLVSAGLILIVFVLSDGSIAPQGWKTPYIIALLVCGVVFLAAFLAWEHFLEQEHKKHRSPRTQTQWWVPPPLMPVSMWARANGKLAVVFAIAFLEWCSFNTFTFWSQLYYQEYQGLSPILTMLRLLPMSVTGVLCNVIVVLVVRHVDLVILIAIGTLFTGISNLLFAVIVPSAPYWAFGFPAAILSVVGGDFVFATGTMFVTKVCDPQTRIDEQSNLKKMDEQPVGERTVGAQPQVGSEQPVADQISEQSVGAALFQTVMQLGTAFGIAISTVAYNAAVRRKAHALGVEVDATGSDAPRPALLVGYRDAMWAGFAFGVFGALLALVFLRGVGAIGKENEAPQNDLEKKQVSVSPTSHGQAGVEADAGQDTSPASATTRRQ